MTRYERKLFFERLLALREAYRADDHLATELTIEGVFAFAEETYNDAAAAEAATTTVTGGPAAD
jgi:hypothetical protein